MRAQTISKPEMLQKVLITVLGVLVQGTGLAGGEEEEDVADEMDTKSPYSSATKVHALLSASEVFSGWLWG